MRCASASVVVVVVAVGGCFSLERADGLTPGTIKGRAVRDDGDAAAFVKVSVDGAALVRRADNAGNFAANGLSLGTWIVRFSDDNDGDGLVDNAAVVAVSVPVNVDGGVSGVDLGDVVVSGTVVYGGVVVDDAGAPVVGATVAVARTGASVGAVDVGDLGAEAFAVSGDDGAFVVGGVARGPVQLCAFTDVLASALVVAPQPSRDLRLVAAPIGGRRARVAVRFGVALPAQGDVDVWLMAPGAPPTGNPTRRQPSDQREAFDVVPGVFDVYGVLVDGSGQGVLLSQVAAPDAVTQWGLMLLADKSPCAAGGIDVDGDGVVGFDLVDIDALDDDGAAGDDARAARDRFVACADVCLGDVFAVCDGRDCDDDADGQADVSEDPACLGPCGGADLDLDRSCDRFDLTPPCAVDDGRCVLPPLVVLADYGS